MKFVGEEHFQELPEQNFCAASTSIGAAAAPSGIGCTTFDNATQQRRRHILQCVHSPLLQEQGFPFLVSSSEA